MIQNNRDFGPLRRGQIKIRTKTTGNNAFVWTDHFNVNRGYAVNGLNQYLTAASASFTYDPNGNLTYDGATSFVYDVENRLVVASGGRASSLRYDPMGRLYEMIGPSSALRFLYDGDALVGEYSMTASLIRRYMWGPGIDELILWDEGSTMNCSGTRVLHGDLQNSTIAQADCFGNQTAINRYDEYGIPQATNTGRFQYTSQSWLYDLGLYHYKNRIYSPSIGRFLQIDPVGYNDNINIYAYSENDPVNHIDSNGATKIWFNVGTGELHVDPEVKGRVPYKIQATSGRAGGCMNNASCQDKSFEGPIPRGLYQIRSRELSDPSLAGDVARRLKGDWGDWRVRLHRQTVDEENRMSWKPTTRDNFFLHGGDMQGSAGCIDVGGGICGNQMTNQIKGDILRDPDGLVPLRVEDRGPWESNIEWQRMLNNIFSRFRF
jgi:RHS repeat-associated protein